MVKDEYFLMGLKARIKIQKPEFQEFLFQFPEIQIKN